MRLPGFQGRVGGTFIRAAARASRLGPGDAHSEDDREVQSQAFDFTWSAELVEGDD